MNPEEVAPFVGKPIRMTLADGRIIAGTLHATYTVVSAPVMGGSAPVREVVEGANVITDIVDASDDAAAAE